MGVTLVNSWVWHFGKMYCVRLNVKLCFIRITTMELCLKLTGELH
jgi:hypothetical protein